MCAGTVGSGIVKRFLQVGATVIAPLRSEGSKGRLSASLAGVATERLHTPVADWSTEPGAEQLAAYVKEHGGVVDHVVSISGARWYQRRCHRDCRYRT